MIIYFYGVCHQNFDLPIKKLNYLTEKNNLNALKYSLISLSKKFPKGHI